MGRLETMARPALRFPWSGLVGLCFYALQLTCRCLTQILLYMQNMLLKQYFSVYDMIVRICVCVCMCTHMSLYLCISFLSIHSFVCFLQGIDYVFRLNFAGVQLTYNVVLVSGVQQSKSVIHINISILFSHIGYTNY